MLVFGLVECKPSADKGDQHGHSMSELACQSAAAILVSSEAKDLPVRPDRKGGHLHHRRASLASFPSLQGAIIIKGIEQVFRGFAAHRC